MSSIAFEELAALRTRTQGQKTLVSIEGRDQVPVVVATATPGDHHQIHNLLMDVFRAPSAAEFQAQLEEPTYEPINRLVVKRARQIAAHCRIIDRAVTFGPLHLVVSELADVATRAEFRDNGYATALIRTAEQRIRQDGAQLGLLTTDSPEFYRRLGWIEAVHQGHSKARARDILAELSAANSLRPKPSLLSKSKEQEALTIRQWRHVELDALISIYRNNLSGSYGRTLRTEAFWRWLITRRGFDRILVAIRGSSKLQLDESSKRIEGYAAMSGSRIVELMACGTRRDEVRRSLLARACRDAIERDDEVVQLDAPPNNGLHRLMLAAGGNYYSNDQDRGTVTMAKTIDPFAMLEMMRPLLHDRARARGQSRPAELGLHIEDRRLCIVLMPRSVKIQEGRLARSFLRCSKQEFDRLLLGFGDVRQAILEGRVEASTRVAGELANTLWPMLPFWRPPLDNLPVDESAS